VARHCAPAGIASVGLLALALGLCGLCVGCRLATSSSVPPPAGSTAGGRGAWQGVHFVVRQWSRDPDDILRASTCTPQKHRPDHLAPPALLTGDPLGIRRWTPTGVRYPDVIGFSGDGRWLAMLAADDQGRLRAFAVDGPQAVPRCLAPDAALAEAPADRAFCWAPTGDRFYLVDELQRVWVGEAGAGSARSVGEAGRRPRPQGARARVASVSEGGWSRDGSTVAWVGPERRLCLYRVGQAAAEETRALGGFFWLSPGGDAALLATDSADGTKPRYALWRNGRSQEPELLAERPHVREGEIHWSPDGRWLALPKGDSYYQGRGVVLCDTRTGRTREDANLVPIAWRPNSTGVLCWSDNEWKILPVNGGNPFRVAAPPMKRDMILWPASRYVAACDNSGIPVVLDLETLNATGLADAGDVGWYGIGRFDADGTRLLVVKFTGRRPPGTPLWREVAEGFTEFGICDLVARTTRTISLQPLSRDVGLVAVANTEAWWSPDGRHILFMYRALDSRDRPEDRGWAALSLDTGRMARIAGHNDDVFIPVPGTGGAQD